MEKYFENEAAEPYLEPYKISVMGRFCENAMVKNHIIDVWYDSKHTSQFVQDSKTNLKWRNKFKINE